MAAVVFALALAGCQVELHTKLTENDANQILAVLMSNGVDAAKVASGEDGFTITVPKDDTLRAIALLQDVGLPRETMVSIGKVFEKSGIMSSPFEERVRYIYALGEEVAHTLQQIDGVVTARVHIVLPEAPQLGQPVRPSSAAVFVKHHPSVDLDFFVPQIRRLVSSSIEGLSYEAVTVVLTASATLRPVNGQSETVLTEALPGVLVRAEDAGRLRVYAASAGAALLLLLVAGAAGAVRLLRNQPRKPVGAGEAAPTVEP
ncbi:type III secretion system inner membrane ring lipoprotein SctJ [Chthonobacter rhizosphaerae]|uniref:type III secretion system inner membrane ring lipoprotein SctJ n=1 Tax=Chthonobacter rhizosphaerae TaxID=2735553 RepID=UPI0015EF0145